MRRLDAAARELEAQKRQKAMDISGNKLDLSGEARKNKVMCHVASSALPSQSQIEVLHIRKAQKRLTF